MTREYLVKHYIMSTYISENDVVDYFINLSSCKEKDIAYLYSYEEKDIIKMRIFKIIWRSENPYFYDNFKEDALSIVGDACKADASAEFFTDDDSCLVWFKYSTSYKSKKIAKNTNELLDHLIKLLESNNKRFSFEWAAGGENISMEIFDKDKKIGYLATIVPMNEGFDKRNISK